MLKAAGVVSAIVLALGCSDGEDSSGIDDDLFSPAVFADPHSSLVRRRGGGGQEGP
ncbi:MAG: hypothetical protein OES69_08570 [Myxococcales bacterium]|nr:hypothetical protein [Myxococcales bacterium]